MKKNTFKYILIGVMLCVIVGTFTYPMWKDLFKKEPKPIPDVYISIKEDTVMVSDGEKIYYNAPNGDIMYIPAFEAEPKIYLTGYDIMAVNSTHFLVRDKNKLMLFNREEMGLDDTFDIKTSCADLTDEAIYYRDDKTGNVMKIDRDTKEKSVFLPYDVNKFVFYGDTVWFTQNTPKSGIISYNEKDGSAANYAMNITVVDFTMRENELLYIDKKDNSVTKHSFNSNNKRILEGVKAERIEFLRGGVYYVTPKDSKTMVVDRTNMYQ